jgi:hypothetical protein
MKKLSSYKIIDMIFILLLSKKKSKKIKNSLLLKIIDFIKKKLSLLKINKKKIKIKKIKLKKIPIKYCQLKVFNSITLIFNI